MKNFCIFEFLSESRSAKIRVVAAAFFLRVKFPIRVLHEIRAVKHGEFAAGRLQQVL